MKKLVITLCLLMLLPAICYAATSETGDTSAIPVSAYGKTSGGVVTSIQVDSDGKVVLSDAAGWTESGTTTSTSNDVEIGGDFNLADKIIYVDDVDEIQTAIDTLEAADGGIVHILSGVYEVTTQIDISGNKQILVRGDGKSTKLNNAITGGNMFVVGTDSTVTSGCSFRDLFLVGRSTDRGSAYDTGNEIKYINHNQAYIENCTFYGGGTGAILSTVIGDNNYSYNLKLNGVAVTFYEGYGIRFETASGYSGSWNNSSKIVNSRFAHNGICLDFETASGTLQTAFHSICNSYIETSTTTDVLINMVNADYNSFVNCTFDGVNGYTAINIDSDSGFNGFDNILNLVGNIVDASGDNYFGQADYEGKKISAYDDAVFRICSINHGTPELTLQRGTASDVYGDWKIRNFTSQLRMAYSTSGSDFSDKAYLLSTGYFGLGGVPSVNFDLTGSGIVTAEIESGDNYVRQYHKANNGASTTAIVGQDIYYNNGDSVAEIKVSLDDADDAGKISFGTQDSGGTVTTRMTIDSSGNANIDGTTFVVDANNDMVGIGVTPESKLHLATSTEEVEVVDAGSTGATEQDWIEVQVGDTTGYIRVYATK